MQQKKVPKQPKTNLSTCVPQRFIDGNEDHEDYKKLTAEQLKERRVRLTEEVESEKQSIADAEKQEEKVYHAENT